MYNKHKPIVFCGVTDINSEPVKMSKEEQEEFCKNLSNGGEYNVIFDETNTIPKIMKGLINE